MNLQSFQAWLLPKKALSFSSSKFFHGSYCSVVNFRVLKVTFKALHIWTSASLWRFVCVQLCPTLCNPMDCSPPGSSVHGISQARILEWVAISFSRGSSQSREQTWVSYISCIGRRILYCWVTRKYMAYIYLLLLSEKANDENFNH